MAKEPSGSVVMVTVPLTTFFNFTLF